ALRAAIESERVRDVRGFGVKAGENSRAALEAAAAGDGGEARVVLDRALAIGEPIVAALRADPAGDGVELAGPARRWTDSVKDLDVIATAHDPAALAAAFAALGTFERVHSSGPAGARATTHSGLRVDLRIVAPEQFGNLLQHFTGSKQHNMALRDMAVRKGLHVSEYEVLDDATGETRTCATEADVYALLGLAYIEPELREDRGEREVVSDGCPDLPRLLEPVVHRCVLHFHSFASAERSPIDSLDF